MNNLKKYLAKILLLFFMSIFPFQIFSLNNFIHVDNSQNRMRGSFSHDLDSIMINENSIMDVSPLIMETLCNGDIVCRINIGLDKIGSLGSIYVDLNETPIEIVECNINQPGDYQMNVDTTTNTITIEAINPAGKKRKG